MHKSTGIKDRLDKVKKFNYSAIFAVIFFILVITSTTRHIPYIKVVADLPTKVLWSVGVMQNYQLFDWISRFNFKIEIEAQFKPLGSGELIHLNPEDFLPNSVRYNLFQLRFYGVKWLLPIRGEKRRELKLDIKNRIAAKYCKIINEDSEVFIQTILHRITENNIDFTRKPQRFRYKFKCKNGRAGKGTFY